MGKNLHLTQTLTENRLTPDTASVSDWIIYMCERSLRHRSANTYQQNKDLIEQIFNSNVNGRTANILSNLQLFLSIPDESILPKHTRRQHADKEGHQIR